MISLSSISLYFGPRALFDDVSATINTRDRIGLVGSNGAGKTTFFKTLLGQTALDTGKIQKASYVTIGYLPQDGITVAGKSVYKEVESAFDDVLTLQKRVDDASHRLQTLETNNPEYHETLELIGHWEHQLEGLEAHRLQSKIEKVLLGLGFSLSDMQRDTGEFSGGWQMRIALAKLLLQEPSLLLMDEPTNHLDLPTQRWLERYLNGYEGAMMIISHDRAFLDTLCTRTFALSMGRLETYSGNYSFFAKESEQRKALLEKAYEGQQKELARQQKFIDRFRSKATKAKQVQSRIKALEKVERIELSAEEKRMHFRFPPAPRSGQVLLNLEGIRKDYDDLCIFQNLDFKLERGDRVAVVGVNGAGKSTFAKILAEEESYQAGEFKVGANVYRAYFAQHQAEQLDLNSTALSIIESELPRDSKTNPRSILGAFLFHGDDVFKPVSVLSGGEKCRLALAKILCEKVNCLIMDEPTNHLDMHSQDVLQEALQNFEGAVVIVSHNRSFLDPLVNKVLEISPKGTRMFLGNVSEYLAKVEAEEGVETPNGESFSRITSISNPKERRRLEAERRSKLAPLRKKAQQLEKEITSLEEKISTFETAMTNPAFFQKGEETTEQMKAYESTKRKLERIMAEWENITHEIESFE